MKIKSIVMRVKMAELGLSQAELSNKTGLSRQSISTILCRGSGSPVNIGKIAKALDIPIETIIKE